MGTRISEPAILSACPSAAIEDRPVSSGRQLGHISMIVVLHSACQLRVIFDQSRPLL